MPADDENANLKRALFAVSDAVLGAAVLLCLGVYGGAWLDTRLHTSPWLSVSLSILGAGLGLARMVMKANALDTRSKTTSSVKTGEPGAAKRMSESSSSFQDGSVAPKLPFERFSDEEQN